METEKPKRRILVDRQCLVDTNKRMAQQIKDLTAEIEELYAKNGRLFNKGKQLATDNRLMQEKITHLENELLETKRLLEE